MNKTYTIKNPRRNVKKRVIWKQDEDRDFMIERGGGHPVNKKACCSEGISPMMERDMSTKQKCTSNFNQVSIFSFSIPFCCGVCGQVD